jgi:hypothetical protein
MATKTKVHPTAKIPVRIEDEREDIGYYYEIDSDTHPGRKYELHYDMAARRWRCNCPDTRYNGQPECKHVQAVLHDVRARQQQQILIQAERVALAAEREQEQQQPAQDDEQYAACLIALLGEMKPAETALERAERHIEILKRRIEGLEENLQNLQDNHYAMLRELIDTVKRQDETISALESRLAEFQVAQGTIQEEFEFEINRALDIAQEERVRISAQSVVIDGPISRKRSAKASESERAPKMKIEPVERNGIVIACIVDGFRVNVVKGEFSTSCNCGEADGRACEHGKAVDKWLAQRNQKREQAA